MGNPITAQLVGYDFPGLGPTTPYQSAEKALGGSRIPPILQKYIDDIPVLVASAPQILLFPPDPDKDLVDVERVSPNPWCLRRSRRANCGPNSMHQRRIDSWLTVIPRSAGRSSIFLWLWLNRLTNQTA